MDGQLILSDGCQDGYKPVVYAPIPEFDQTKQFVCQADPVDMGDYIDAGVVVMDLPPEIEGEGFEL